MGDLEKESSLRDFEAAEDGGCLAAPGRFRMSDYLSELVGAQEVTKDEAYDTAVAAVRGHASVVQALAKSVAARTKAVVALEKSAAPVRAGAAAMEPALVDALAAWAAPSEDPAEPPPTAAVEDASRALVGGLLNYATDLNKLKAKVAKARTKQRENMDHYASKVPRLTRAVEAATREKARREARAEAAAAKAEAEGTPVPATCHAFYESSDADQVKALADAEDRLRRNEKKLEGAKGDYAATNAAAIAALTSAVADSTPETVPILKDLLSYEADIITAMLAYESRLDAAAAALPESEEPARAEPPAEPDAEPEAEEGETKEETKTEGA